MQLFIKKNSHLSFDQRCKIESMLNQRKRKFEIANELDYTLVDSRLCEKTIYNYIEMGLFNVSIPDSVIVLSLLIFYYQKKAK